LQPATCAQSKGFVELEGLQLEESDIRVSVCLPRLACVVVHTQGGGPLCARSCACKQQGV